MIDKRDIVVFSNEWFEYHQANLVRFSNTTLGRYILRINGKRSDVGKNKITKIMPNAIWWNEYGKTKAEFRTHAKFSKRMYYAFKPVWHLLHMWDMLLANRLNYALNLGFDTLTKYPTAGTSGDAVDGSVSVVTSNQTWAAIHDATSATQVVDTSNTMSLQILTDINTDRFFGLRRIYTLFNTSSLGNPLSIDEATLSLYGNSIEDTFVATDFKCNVYSGSPVDTSSLTNIDYNKDRFGTTELSTGIFFLDADSSGYNNFSLNASGLAQISTSGISKFALRESTYDVANVAPTWQLSRSARIIFYQADMSGTSFDPKLVVVYQAALQASVSTSNPYADGKCMTNTGSGWSNLSNADMYFTTYTSDNATTITYNSTDPSNILTSVIDNYNSFGGDITYSGTIDTTGTTVSYTFNTQTILQCINKIIELAPAGWYWYVDSATNLIHFHQKSSTADHTFTLGKDIKLLKIDKSTENIVNTVFFTGGDTGFGENLFLKFQNSDSVSRYGVHSTVYSDKRVTLTATATTISNNILETKSNPEIRLMLEIADSNLSTGGYDIETIKVGDVINIRNVKGSTGSSLWDIAQWDIDYWDFNITQLATMYLQIVRTEYKPDSMIVYCSTTPPDISKRIEDINRNLETLQTLENPTAPS